MFLYKDNKDNVPAQQMLIFVKFYEAFIKVSLCKVQFPRCIIDPVCVRYSLGSHIFSMEPGFKGCEACTACCIVNILYLLGPGFLLCRISCILLSLPCENIPDLYRAYPSHGFLLYLLTSFLLTCYFIFHYLHLCKVNISNY